MSRSTVYEKLINEFVEIFKKTERKLSLLYEKPTLEEDCIWNRAHYFMVASIAFCSVYDNNTVTILMALIGPCISLYGY